MHSYINRQIHFMLYFMQFLYIFYILRKYDGIFDTYERHQHDKTNDSLLNYFQYGLRSV